MKRLTNPGPEVWIRGGGTEALGTEAVLEASPGQEKTWESETPLLPGHQPRSQKGYVNTH